MMTLATLPGLQPSLALIPNLGPMEIIAILVIALLLFGKRLPEVGRSLGKGIVEFKKGIKGVEEEIDTETDRSRARREDRSQFTDGRDRAPLVDDRRVGRADAVDVPQGGTTQP